MDPNWQKVVLPGNLRNQFREQFGESVAEQLQPIDDQFSPVTMPEVLHAFDAMDRSVGLHWPILATGLWQHGSHMVPTAYIETAGTLGQALAGLLSTSTTIYPIYTTTSQMTAEGLILRTRPTYPLEPRHWSIFQILGILSQTAVFKKFAPEETKQMKYEVSIPRDDFSETLEKLTTCEIVFDVPMEKSCYIFPHALLAKKTGHKHKELNKLLFQQIEKQTRLPTPDARILNRLRHEVYSRLPELLTAEEAAETLETSRSTFQRMLKRNGEEYAKIVREMRKEFVLIRLTQIEPDDDLHEELGFTSRRSLNAFCKAELGVPLNRLL